MPSENSPPQTGIDPATHLRVQLAFLRERATPAEKTRIDWWLAAIERLATAERDAASGSSVKLPPSVSRGESI